MQIRLRTCLTMLSVVLLTFLSLPASATANSTFLLTPTTPIEIDFKGANGLTGPDFLTQGIFLNHLSTFTELDGTLYDNGVALGTFMVNFAPNSPGLSDAASWASPASTWNGTGLTTSARVDLSGLLLHGDVGKIVFSTPSQGSTWLTLTTGIIPNAPTIGPQWAFGQGGPSYHTGFPAPEITGISGLQVPEPSALAMAALGALALAGAHISRAYSRNRSL